MSLDACIKLKETKKLRAVGEQPSKHRRRRKRKQQAKQKMESTKEPVSYTAYIAIIVLNFNIWHPQRKMKLTSSTFWRRHYNHKKVLPIMFEISISMINNFPRINCGGCGKNKINKPELEC